MQIPVSTVVRWQLQCLYTSLKMWKQMYDTFAGAPGEAAEDRQQVASPPMRKGGCLGPADLKG